MVRTVAITSGKGGVGKTNISVNLTIYLASLGLRTCLFDADLGLANINIILGLYPKLTLEDVILNNKGIEDIIIKNYEGVDIIPGSSGVEKIANLDVEQIDRLINSFSKLDGYDFFFFDTSAGVSKNVISFCLASSEVILVVTPEPTSLTDGYAMLKILHLNGFNNPIRIVVNQCKDISSAKFAYKKLKETVYKNLNITVLPYGAVPQDQNIEISVSRQKPFISLYPATNASKSIKNIAKRLMENQPAESDELSMETFWTRFLQFVKSPLKLPNNQETKEGESPTIEKDNSDDSTEKTPIAEGVNCQLAVRLTESLSCMSEELHLLRKAIEHVTNNVAASNSLSKANKNEEENLVKPESVILDLESFVKNHKK